MKKIILSSPVDFNFGGKSTRYAPGVEYTVNDEVAESAFMKLFISKVEDVVKAPKTVEEKPVEVKPEIVEEEPSKDGATKKSSRQRSKSK